MYLMYKTDFNQYPEDEERLMIFDQMLATFTSLSAKSLITQVTYNCDDSKTIGASFYKGEPQPVKPGDPPIPSGSVKIILSDGRSLDLSQTISADGSRYANENEFVFWSRGDEALILEDGVEKDYKGCVIIPETSL